MRTHKLPNHLRSYRKRLGLSQAEIAYLLGCKSAAKVSRYERFQRIPGLVTALRYEAVFGVPANVLFAGLADEARRATLVRQHKLSKQHPLTSHGPNHGI